LVKLGISYALSLTSSINEGKTNASQASGFPIVVV